MTIIEYKETAEKNNYFEEEIYEGLQTAFLKDFIEYEKCELETKIYLCELVIYRHFPPGGIVNKDEVDWFIENYFKEYELDLIEMERTTPIKVVKELIMTDDIFGKATIGSVFMYSIIDFYAKFKLGFRPNRYNFTDNKKYEYINVLNRQKKSKHIQIDEALELLEEMHFPISSSLKKINQRMLNKMDELLIQEKGTVYFTISKRLWIARNAIMHGEKFCFFDRGKYMLMLYILFQLNEQCERLGKQNYA